MSLLVVLLPPRPRLRAAGDAPPPRADAEYRYVLSRDGLAVAAHGRCAAALLPAAQRVVAVVGAEDLGWQRITLPKAPAARLRAALAGVLEDALLDDADALHLALEPGAAAQRLAWVAVTHRGWLAAQLEALERAGHAVDQVAPAVWPGEPAAGHFWHGDDDDAADPPRLSWRDAQGVLTLRLHDGLARSLQPQWTRSAGVTWSASPSAAEAAAHWLGEPVAVRSDDEGALAAARSPWNLRQFDLAAPRRGLRTLAEGWRRLREPAWAPLRWALLALVAVQVGGLNLWAWQLREQVEQRRAAQVELLRSTHPQVRAVLDAPLQMQRETALLRAAAGRAGQADLEALLGAAAAAWPADLGPAQALHYEAGRLSLSAAGWSPPHIEAFGERLRAEGWRLEHGDGQLRLSRPAPAAGGGRS
jgi:general secretion pathway protein L